MFSNILGYKVYNEDKSSLLKYINEFEKVNIVSGNPEILFNGLSNRELFDEFNSKQSVIIPDGVGIVIAAKIAGVPVKEKIAGIELVEDILKYCQDNNKSVYLLGTKQETIEKCVLELRRKYTELSICGYRNGFFNLDNCEDLISEINNKKPYAIFVAMGSPRQERFIIKYMDKLSCSIFMGVGGSFDVFAGELRRAPRWMIKLGLEWLYRVSMEPWRIKRLGSIPKFILKVIVSKYIIKDKKN
ncbi:MAG: tagA [Clostridiaceae bacterium]|jgi:N-acetylglucosaminyldiphosphoundecaprenol N-acetyl-beta-D-mannosaminyltransferase|nr:tagA [Clostridiaceae bacterium]